MNLTAINVMCTAIPEPRAWQMDDGREGVTYKVELSDGTTNTQMQCADVDVYQQFEAFKRYDVQIDLIQTNYEGRKGVKALILAAYPNDGK